ncbi:isochorismatase family protein [Nonomuraea sp. NPDC050536]|uniref:isochorismatase family protein n=1 Tax=Nonomuraea sp. NPDC050536 TaxID=3364366 RepID=UPI0037C776BC
MADAFRARNAPVVLVRVNGAAPGRTETPPRTTAMPDGWDTIVDDLTGHPDDLVITKRTWGAFHDTALHQRLHERGITQIVLAGVATSAGVESTARAAHEHGYHVTLATDAMTDLDLDAHHHTVERVFPRIGQRATTSDLLTNLNH